MTKPDFDQNWGIVGHQNVVDFLKASIRNDKVSHAYLFSGQAGLGKKKITRNFIGALLCPNQVDGRPCDKCVNCEQLEKNIHPDVIWVQRLRDEKSEKLKKNISIEQVREIKRRLMMGSFLNSYKVAVISEAELLSIGASNALLKLLEEPAEKVILFLLTKYPDYLPQTIFSRCQQIKLELVSRRLIYDYLIDLGSGRALADELSYLANGCPGTAISYYRDIESWKDYQSKVKDFINLVDLNNLNKLKTAAELAGAEKDLIGRIKYLSEILDIWSLVIRDIILLKNSRREVPAGLTNYWLLNQLKNAKLYNKNSLVLVDWLKKIEATKKMFNQNINPQLAIESLLLSFE